MSHIWQRTKRKDEMPKKSSLIQMKTVCRFPEDNKNNVEADIKVKAVKKLPVVKSL